MWAIGPTQNSSLRAVRALTQSNKTRPSLSELLGVRHMPAHHPAANAPPSLSVNFGRRVLVPLRISGWRGALARERRMFGEESMASPSGIVQNDLMVCQECVGGGQGEGAAYDVRRQNKENGLKTQ